MQDIPLAAGDPGYDIVADSASRLHEFADRPAIACWGLQGFRVRRGSPDGFRQRLPQPVHAWEDAGHYVLEDAHERIIPLVERFPRRQPAEAGDGIHARRMTASCNIAATLPRMAAEVPDRVAIRCPGKRGADGLATTDVAMTYAELDTRSDAIAAGLLMTGIARGDRCVLMVRPSPEFFALMFALFKAGIVPVLVDPGIDRRALKQCLAEAEPSAFIGIPLAQLARRLLGWARVASGIRSPWADAGSGRAATGRYRSVGCELGPAVETRLPMKWRPSCSRPAPPVFPKAWSTGIGISSRRSRCWAAPSASKRVALTCRRSAPVALFDPALGLTSIIPDMDRRAPAKADPITCTTPLIACAIRFAGPGRRAHAIRQAVARRSPRAVGRCASA